MIGVNVDTIMHDKKYVPQKGYHKSEFIDNVATWTFTRSLFKSPLLSPISFAPLTPFSHLIPLKSPR